MTDQYHFHKIFEEAINLFEEGNYDSSVETLINLYNAEYNCEEILTILYDCFILPNKDEFVSNFTSQNKITRDFTYSELPLDFIPVSDNKYYIFDKHNLSFCGSINFSDNKHISGTNKFDSLLVVNLWNPSSFLDAIYKYKYQNVYLCFNNSETLLYFISFCKLPNFNTILSDEHATVFFSPDEYSSFMRNNSYVYLPHTIYGKDISEYIDINKSIHSERLLSPRTCKPFITIAIPSYNRGSLALKSVQHMLQLFFDSELEILISNNGSTDDIEGYSTIKEINDSRIRYISLDTNKELFGNVVNVISNSSGHYIMLASDEDELVLENFQSHLDFIINNDTCAIFQTTGIGSNFLSYADIIDDYQDRFINALNLNYITGVTYKSAYLEQQNATSKVLEIQQNSNLFLSWYPHIGYALIGCLYGNYIYNPLILYKDPITLKESDDINNKISSYMHPSSRIEQFDSSIMLCCNLLSRNDDVLSQIILDRICKIYHLVYIGFILKTRSFIQEYDWLSVCTDIHKHIHGFLTQHFHNMNRYNEFITQNDYNYIEKIQLNPAQSLLTPLEIKDYEVRRDKILNSINTL